MLQVEKNEMLIRCGFLLFSVSDAGSDWSTIYFMDIASREKLPDVITRTKFSSLRWTTDNRGIFYTTYADKVEKNESTSNDPVSKSFFCSIGIVSFVSRQPMQYLR